MARNSLIVGLIFCIVVLAEVSGHKWFNNDKKSSACVGDKTLACTKHELTCPQNQQIKINYAFYGFVRKEHGCTTHKITCNSQKGCDCQWLRGDCGLPYIREDNAEVMRCSGQRSCNPSSAMSSENSLCDRILWGNSKYNPKNSYTEIDYECIKAQRIDPTEPNVIRGQQIVLNASKDYAYTYTVSSSRWGSVLFYQTNQKQKTFLLHGHPTQAGVEYRLFGKKIQFTIQPNTDTFIVLTGRSLIFQSDLTVSYKRHKTDEKTTTATTHPSTQPTIKQTYQRTQPTIKPTYQRPQPTIKPTTPRRFSPKSTSFRPKPEVRTTTEAFEKKTHTTTEAFEKKTKPTTEAFEKRTKSTTEAFEKKTKPTTEAFEKKTHTTTGPFEVTTETTTKASIMEEMTKNIEDEIITKAFEEKTQRTTGPFEVTTETTTKASITEEVTRNIEDEIITKAFEEKTQRTTEPFQETTTKVSLMKEVTRSIEDEIITKAFEEKTQRTTGPFQDTTTEAFIMEEVTRNIEDEIIKEENNDKMRPQASVAEEHSRLTGGLIGGVVGVIVALIIILLIGCILKRRGQKTATPVAMNKGINNPGYEVSYINPKLQEPPPTYEEINPRYFNSSINGDQKNDFKDDEFRHLAGLNVKDFDLNEKE